VNIYSTTIGRTDVFSDNFDDGNIDDWITSGTNNSWGLVNGRLSDSPNSDYVNNTNSWIAGSTINLNGYDELLFEFIFTGNSEQYHDRLHIKTSSDGISWYDHGYLHGLQGDEWRPVEIELNSNNYTGGLFIPGFNFISDTSNTEMGFLIDNLKVTAADHEQYGYKNGSSMAAPFVAGIAGLIKAKNQDLSIDEIKAIIINSVDTLPTLAGMVSSEGRVNADKALSLTKSPDDENDKDRISCFISTLSNWYKR